MDRTTERPVNEGADSFEEAVEQLYSLVSDKYDFDMDLDNHLIMHDVEYEVIATMPCKEERKLDLIYRVLDRLDEYTGSLQTDVKDFSEGYRHEN